VRCTAGLHSLSMQNMPCIYTEGDWKSKMGEGEDGGGGRPKRIRGTGEEE
jgi:hypothetical protein